MTFLRSLPLRSYLAVAALRDREDGQALVEYGLILFLVSIASITILSTLGGHVSTIYSRIAADI